MPPAPQYAPPTVLPPPGPAPSAAPAPQPAQPAPPAPPAPAPAAAPPPAVAPASVPKAAAPPPGEPPPKKTERPSPVGFFIGGGLGLELCYTSSCSDAGRSVGPGPVATLQLGFRPDRSILAVVGEGSLGAHSFTPPITAGQGGSAWTGSAYGGLRIYPVELGAITPWIGVLGGFHQYTERTKATPFDVESARQLRRIAGRLEVGLDVALGDHAVIGPYFDWNPEFAGVECTKLGADAAKCTELHTPSRRDAPDAVAPGDQPMFMSFGVQAAWRQ